MELLLLAIIYWVFAALLYDVMYRVTARRAKRKAEKIREMWGERREVKQAPLIKRLFSMFVFFPFVLIPLSIIGFLLPVGIVLIIPPLKEILKDTFF